ncbi:MAG: U3 snoRNP protein [Sclerophora amabilis]|nr:MAG: U3 snoRNP protein [Sclerophora amabilis]
MAGASDKARFYLEQSVPELQEFERKKVFSRDEIGQIARKRSDFEHKLNARGSQPSDYARYAEYEINLETLRRKRVKRLGIKVNSHAGQRRIFFVLDRATRKFQGDLGLWMQYIDYARREKANKKLSEIFGSILRFHPTKPELWIYAARHAMDVQADMAAARSYMQRGLRFCKSSKLLWLEYAKLELGYVTKIAARRKILGLAQGPSNQQVDPSESNNEDTIALPVITAEDIDPSTSQDGSIDHDALQTLSSTPALTGAIPLAVFDAAMKQFQNDESLAMSFFDLFTEFHEVPCLQKLLEHVVRSSLSFSPTDPSSLICYVRQPVALIDLQSPDAPRALGLSRDRLKVSFQKTPRKAELVERSILWLHGLLQHENLDEGIRRVLLATLRQTRSVLEDNYISEGDFAGLVERLEDAGLADEVQRMQLKRKSK